MGSAAKNLVELLGSTQVLGHCTFDWREPENGTVRTIEIREHHCERCIQELRLLPGSPHRNIVDRRERTGRFP